MSIKDKWEVVSDVFNNEYDEICWTCAWLDKYGDCRILSQDNMVAEYCTGWDVKLRELGEE